MTQKAEPGRPFSLREKDTTPGKEEVERSRMPEPRMRVIKIKVLSFDTLTPTLSLGERELRGQQ